MVNKILHTGYCSHLRKRPVKWYIWSTALCSAETWRLRKVDHKYVESFEMWCWRRMEKISWTDRLRNEEVLHRVNEERNVLHTVIRRKGNSIGHILRWNCLLKHIIEAMIQKRIGVTGGRRRSCKQLLNGLKDKRLCCILKEEALDRTPWRTGFGKS